jgi:hypothetical protein
MKFVSSLIFLSQKKKRNDCIRISVPRARVDPSVANTHRVVATSSDTAARMVFAFILFLEICNASKENSLNNFSSNVLAPILLYSISLWFGEIELV